LPLPILVVSGSRVCDKEQYEEGEGSLHHGKAAAAGVAVHE
jgi:hypothetical protein